MKESPFSARHGRRSRGKYKAGYRGQGPRKSTEGYPTELLNTTAPNPYHNSPTGAPTYIPSVPAVGTTSTQLPLYSTPPLVYQPQTIPINNRGYAAHDPFRSSSRNGPAIRRNTTYDDIIFVPLAGVAQPPPAFGPPPMPTWGIPHQGPLSPPSEEYLDEDEEDEEYDDYKAEDDYKNHGDQDDYEDEDYQENLEGPPVPSHNLPDGQTLGSYDPYFDPQPPISAENDPPSHTPTIDTSVSPWRRPPHQNPLSPITEKTEPESPAVVSDVPQNTAATSTLHGDLTSPTSQRRTSIPKPRQSTDDLQWYPPPGVPPDPYQAHDSKEPVDSASSKRASPPEPPTIYPTSAPSPVFTPPPRPSVLAKLVSHIRLLPKQLYKNVLMLRLPALYWSRVARIFEDADLNLGEIKMMVFESALKDKGISPGFITSAPGPSLAYFATGEKREHVEVAILRPAYQHFKETWEQFIDSLMREWETFNVISVLLLSAILAILSIDGAKEDPITRYTALASLVCALVSLLYGCLFLVCFGSMRKPYKAAEWALEAQKQGTPIFWNVWVMLGMPAIWLAWSLILCLCSIMSFLWRTDSPAEPDAEVFFTPLSPGGRIAVRTLITVVQCLALIYGALGISTIRRFGWELEKYWKEKIIQFVEWRKVENAKMGVGAAPLGPGWYAGGGEGGKKWKKSNGKKKKKTYYEEDEWNRKLHPYPHYTSAGPYKKHGKDWYKRDKEEDGEDEWQRSGPEQATASFSNWPPRKSEYELELIRREEEYGPSGVEQDDQADRGTTTLERNETLDDKWNETTTGLPTELQEQERAGRLGESAWQGKHGPDTGTSGHGFDPSDATLQVEVFSSAPATPENYSSATRGFDDQQDGQPSPAMDDIEPTPIRPLDDDGGSGDMTSDTGKGKRAKKRRRRRSSAARGEAERDSDEDGSKLNEEVPGGEGHVGAGTQVMEQGLTMSSVLSPDQLGGGHSSLHDSGGGDRLEPPTRGLGMGPLTHDGVFEELAQAGGSGYESSGHEDLGANEGYLQPERLSKGSGNPAVGHFAPSVSPRPPLSHEKSVEEGG